ncbi:ankyrin repeat-containing domain protein [Chytridium lagenaria]|nr:ankyrin repeat-containing domain protein [Chytridium lagenaria]
MAALGLSDIEVLPLELFGSVIVHLHPYKSRQLRRLSRRYHSFIDTDDFQFARNNLLAFFAEEIRTEYGGGVLAPPGYDERVQRRSRRQAEPDSLPSLSQLNWKLLGSSYRAALISILNFTSTTLRMINPDYHGLADTAPPGYDMSMDDMALDALRTAITLSEIDSTADGCFVLQWAATNTDADLFQRILESTPANGSSRARDRAFHLACRYGKLPAVKMLLNAGVHPANHDNAGLRAACSSGHSAIVRLLLDTGRVSPSASDNFSIIAASGAGHAAVVRMLLDTGLVDPTENENEALRSASLNGHADVVRLLLIEEVDEEWVTTGDAVIATANIASGSSSLSSTFPSSPEGHFAPRPLITLADEPSRPPRRTTLIPRPGVDASAYSNYSIKMACFYGHTEVVELLLSCEGVDPSIEDNSCLRNAAEFGHLAIVRLLLAHPRCDPSANNNYALRSAAARGQAEVVRALLDHPLVDPTCDGHAAIREATENQHSEVLRILLDRCFPANEPQGPLPPGYIVGAELSDTGCAGSCLGMKGRRGSAHTAAPAAEIEIRHNGNREGPEMDDERVAPNRRSRRWNPFKISWKRQ